MHLLCHTLVCLVFFVGWGGVGVNIIIIPLWPFLSNSCISILQLIFVLIKSSESMCQNQVHRLTSYSHCCGIVAHQCAKKTKQTTKTYQTEMPGQERTVSQEGKRFQFQTCKTCNTAGKLVPDIWFNTKHNKRNCQCACAIYSMPTLTGE